MTLSKYVVLRLAIHFGYARKNVRIGNIASESLLLREAETILGEAIWEKVDQIEELSTEYWSLRKLSQEHQRVSQEIQQLQGELDMTHEIRVGLLKNINEPIQDLYRQRHERISSIDQLRRERDRISARFAEAQRNSEGMKVKIEVLGKEGNKLVEVEKTTQRLEVLRAEIVAILAEKETNAAEIANANRRLRVIDEQISNQKTHGKSKVMGTSQNIGDTNQQISTRRAQMNTITTQMSQLYMDIGRYVSRHVKSVPQCRNIYRDLRGLIDVMAALQRSIYFNSRLAELS
jgi:chromosome segregation ATPase